MWQVLAPIRLLMQHAHVNIVTFHEGLEYFKLLHQCTESLREAFNKKKQGDGGLVDSSTQKITGW